MEFDIEVQHSAVREHMAADALVQLPTRQIEELDIEDDITAYEGDDVYAVININVDSNDEPLTRQSLTLTQKEAHTVVS